ncbi:PilZ domain-containing protein [Pontibacillus salicampi]|uniref:PilZ domain-containing protein n=1 Tax=Pontibacillus salicampi TaxID=1449801 RepID=A0ABV6LIP3_9BACI
MYYKRNEPFRYTFGTPLLGRIQPLHPKGNPFEMKILDLSQHGLKIELQQNSEWSKETTVQVRFSLLDEEYAAEGTIKWLKSYGSTKQYGIDLDTSEDWRKSLINALKSIARQQL